MMEERIHEVQRIDKEVNLSARRDVQELYKLLRKSHRAIAVSWIVSFTNFDFKRQVKVKIQENSLAVFRRRLSTHES